MTVAADAFATATPGGGNLTWTHTPVGTPRGVQVFIVQDESETDQVSTVTYDGDSLTENTGSPNGKANDETEAGDQSYLCFTSHAPTPPQTLKKRRPPIGVTAPTPDPPRSLGVPAHNTPLP